MKIGFFNKKRKLERDTVLCQKCGLEIEKRVLPIQWELKARNEKPPYVFYAEAGYIECPRCSNKILTELRGLR